MLQHEKLVLGSSSQIRRQLLENAGLTFLTSPASLDEEAIKQAFLENETDPNLADIAQLLAQTKASVVSEKHAGHLVVGSDQILVHDGKIFSKPDSIEEARDQLLDLRGKTHELVSAVAVAKDGAIVWSHEAVARLSMRAVSNAFIGAYMAEMGESVTQTVGAYKLEGLGIHLFDTIDGDYFTILGLPMLPLLNFLRARNPDLV